MLIYRVEDVRGCGPFCYGLESVRSVNIEWPLMDEELINKFWVNHHSVYFACPNIDRLFFWFGHDRVIKWLEEGSFKVVVYKTSKVKRDRNQCIFSPHGAKIVGTYDPKVLRDKRKFYEETRALRTGAGGTPCICTS